MIERQIKHADIDLLLPWYANRTLQGQELLAVEQHLRECRECQDQLALLTTMQLVVSDDRTSPIVPKPCFVDLELKIDGENAGMRHPWFGRRGLIAAAVGMIVVFASVLVWNATSRVTPPALYETATTPEVSTSVGYVFDVTFVAGTTIDVHDRTFREIGAAVLAHDREQEYRIVAEVPAGSLEALEHFRTGMQTRPEVASVKVIALQLPVRSE